MNQVKEYHHFKKELIDTSDRVAKCERYVTDLLLTSDLPDSQRDSSICWELKHQASTLQFAKVLAMKRGLPIDICVVGLMLHDINSIVHGKYERHAHLGTPIAIEILQQLGGFSEDELDQISRIIYNHSDKHIWTDDPFQEIGKDVDVLDCFLYEGAFDYYLGNKPLPVFREYLRRAKKVWEELDLPADARFNLLDDYGPSWFQVLQTLQHEQMKGILAILLELSSFDKEQGVCPPPFSILMEDGASKFYGSQQRWSDYVETLADQPVDLTSDKKCKAFHAVLNESLKKNPNYQVIHQCHSFVREGLVSENNSREATNIIASIENSPEPQVCALLFWPLIDIYESLSGKTMEKRLEELGIKLSIKATER